MAPPGPVGRGTPPWDVLRRQAQFQHGGPRGASVTGYNPRGEALVSWGCVFFVRGREDISTGEGRDGQARNAREEGPPTQGDAADRRIRRTPHRRSRHTQAVGAQ